MTLTNEEFLVKSIKEVLITIKGDLQGIKRYGRSTEFTDGFTDGHARVVAALMAIMRLYEHRRPETLPSESVEG